MTVWSWSYSDRGLSASLWNKKWRVPSYFRVASPCPVPFHNLGLGGVLKLSKWVLGRAPADIKFSAFWMLKLTSGDDDFCDSRKKLLTKLGKMVIKVWSTYGAPTPKSWGLRVRVVPPGRQWRLDSVCHGRVDTYSCRPLLTTTMCSHL